MSDAPPAAIQNATPVNNPSAPLPNSPVNAQSASSKANQQAAAAGENQGLSNQDGAVTDQGTNEHSSDLQAAEGTANLERPAFIPTGNQTIDQVNQLLQNANFDGAQEMISEVIKNQELSLNSKAILVDEMGADIAALIINQLETSVRQVKEAGEKEGKRLKEYAFQKIGGEHPDQTWAALQQQVQQDAGFSKDERRTMNELLGAGGYKAELVIDSLIQRYAQGGGTIAPQIMQGDMPSQTGFKPMSKREYQEQIGPAIVKYGESSQEVQALRNRRAISMSRGYN